MAKIPFNVDAYTARLIGRENVAKLNGAILELVKNTYDADASICLLYYEESTGTLYLADNGCGMTEEVIVKHWMTIGRSSKKINFYSDGGRVQTGAKGIGRFALDRIADKCEMLTVSENERNLWKVDWRSFGDNENITDVTADLDKVQTPVKDFISSIKNNKVKDIINNKFDSTCTIFRMTSLRDNWGDKEIKGIKDNLITLIPYELRTIFKIYLFAETTDIEEAEVLHDNDAFSNDYKIEFEVDDYGKTNIKIWRNEFDFGAREDEIFTECGFTDDDILYFLGEPKTIESSFKDILPTNQKNFSNTIGSFSGVLYFSKVQANKEDTKKYFYKDITGRRDFKETFGGVKLYRDSFRVRPYGEPKTSNYDWLLLSGRKNKSPAAISHPTGAWRVNSDQLIGSIFISRLNVTLPDQANREGIVETKEFNLLKEFIINIIQFFERDRQYVFRKLNEYYVKTNAAQEIQHEINLKAKEENKKGSKDKTGDTNKQPIYIEASKAKVALDHKDVVIKNLEEENRLLRALATIGIVTNTYVHEIKDLTHTLNRKIIMAKEAMELDGDFEQGLIYINQANEIRESFNSWFKVTIESVKRDKRKMKKVNLNELIKKLVDTWNETLSGKGIDIEFKSSQSDIFLKCFAYEIESVFSNLIANSISSFEANPIENKKICIFLENNEDNIKILYEDTGVGLANIYKKEPTLILESMETDKRDDDGEPIGTGMGMWIIHNTITNYNGKIDLSRNTIESSGFYIGISLKSNLRRS